MGVAFNCDAVAEILKAKFPNLDVSIHLILTILWTTYCEQVRCVSDGNDFFPVDSSMNTDTCELSADGVSLYVVIATLSKHLKVHLIMKHFWSRSHLAWSETSRYIPEFTQNTVSLGLPAAGQWLCHKRSSWIMICLNVQAQEAFWGAKPDSSCE